jgi:WD40 repeat protein
MSRPEQAPECAWQELSSVLDRELNGLPEHYRVAVVMYDLQGLTRKEAARRLNVPEGTLSGRLTTAHRLLAKRLSRHGLALSGAALANSLAQHAATAWVPTQLLQSTVATSANLAAGGAAAATISIKLTALTEGVLKAMLLTKFKLAAILVAMVLLAASVGLLQLGMPAAGQVPPKTGSISGLAPAAIKKRPLPRFLKHDHTIGPLAWVADGRTLVSITIAPLGRDQALKDQEGAVRIWDLRTGKVIRSLADAHGKFSPWDSSVAVSPDGKVIAAAHTRFGDRNVSGEILLWDAGTGKRKHTLEHGTLGMRCIGFSPDGKIIASGTGGNLGRDIPMVKLWDVKSGKFLRSLDTTNKMAVNLAFSADGKMLAIVAMREDRSHEVMVWEQEISKLTHTFGPDETITSVAFLGGEKTLAGLTYTGRGDAMECTLKLWDVSSGDLKQNRSLKKDGIRLGWGEFSHDGKRVALRARQGDKDVVTLWDVKTGTQFDTLAYPPDAENRVRGEQPAGRATGIGFAFSPDDKHLAVGMGDKTIVLWDLVSGDKPKKK